MMAWQQPLQRLFHTYRVATCLTAQHIHANLTLPNDRQDEKHLVVEEPRRVEPRQELAPAALLHRPPPRLAVQVMLPPRRWHVSQRRTQQQTRCRSFHQGQARPRLEQSTYAWC